MFQYYTYIINHIHKAKMYFPILPYLYILLFILLVIMCTIGLWTTINWLFSKQYHPIPQPIMNIDISTINTHSKSIHDSDQHSITGILQMVYQEQNKSNNQQNQSTKLQLRHKLSQQDRLIADKDMKICELTEIIRQQMEVSRLRLNEIGKLREENMVKQDKIEKFQKKMREQVLIIKETNRERVFQGKQINMRVVIQKIIERNYNELIQQQKCNLKEKQKMKGEQIGINTQQKQQNQDQLICVSCLRYQKLLKQEQVNNGNLRYQLQFAQAQLSMFETESLKINIPKDQNKFSKNKSIYNSILQPTATKKYPLSEDRQKQSMQIKDFLKTQRTNKTNPNSQRQLIISPPPISQFHSQFTPEHLSVAENQFVNETLKSLFNYAIKYRKLYSSLKSPTKNPHSVIDHKAHILLIIKLQNNKIIGAYSHTSFNPSQIRSVKQNIAFLLDISNGCRFVNQSGLNSISYEKSSLVWGLNELVLKMDQPDVVYSNFCKNYNIFWDGKYKIEQFLGVDKIWARISYYDIYQVVAN